MSKKNKNILFFFLSMVNIFSFSFNIYSSKLLPKKNIYIISCTGGGAHTSGAKALVDYLKDEYHIKVINMIKDVLRKRDPVQLFTGSAYSGEDVYDYFLKKQWLWVPNVITKLLTWSFPFVEIIAKKALLNYFKLNKKPDLLISVIPFFNGSILSVAQKLNIPFVTIPVDLDATNYLVGLENKNYSNYYYTIAWDDSKLKEKIKDISLPSSALVTTGFPLRTTFFDIKDIKKIKQDLKIPPKKCVVMLLMGASGSKASYTYTKFIIENMRQPIHLIICLGKNEKLKQELEELTLPKHITLSVIGYTERISDLMSISDILITKPGPSSFVEALYSGVPMILDSTSGILNWEQLNIDLAKKYKIGVDLKNYKQLDCLLDYLCSHPQCISYAKRNIRLIKKHNSYYKIRTLIKNILALY